MTTDNTTTTTSNVNFDEDLLVTLRVDPTYDEPVLHQVLRIAIYDEFHAYESYVKSIEKFGNVEPFVSIMQAEVNHYNALIPLLEKYQVPIPINNWADKIEYPDSLLEACEIGVAAEIDNVKMYDNLITYAQEYPDILDVLYRLQAASYNNHLPAFRRCVQTYSTTAVDVNSIYEQYSTHTTDTAQADAMAKVNELTELVTKVSTGQVTNEDVMKLLGNTNLSFIGGALLGALGTAVVTQIKKDDTEEEI
jgi:hypothetical protein